MSSVYLTSKDKIKVVVIFPTNHASHVSSKVRRVGHSAFQTLSTPFVFNWYSRVNTFILRWNDISDLFSLLRGLRVFPSFHAGTLRTDFFRSPRRLTPVRLSQFLSTLSPGHLQSRCGKNGSTKKTRKHLLVLSACARLWTLQETRMSFAHPIHE